MAKECRAKNPNLCRVHGNGATALDQLNAVAEAAASSKDMNLYMSAREQIDALKDVKVTKHINLQDAGNTERFNAAPLYRKSAVVTARRTEKVERLDTVLSNGLVETSREVPAGEWIVTNPGGEQYAISDEKFCSRYELREDGQYQAKGVIRAFQNPTGGDVEVMAPWGEMQYGDANCWFAAGTTDDLNPTQDCYIIGGDEFKETYGTI
jgi:hypothetical protein